MIAPHEILNLPQSLGDGLLLRQATPADIERVAKLNSRILAEEGESPSWFEAWTSDLMSGRHPVTTAADFVIGEDTKTGQIVSSMCSIPQVWFYEDIPFGVGRPELVVTDPAYRRQGLVRAIFEVIHALSAAQGHLAQAITGIPWFYRQFGYEYTLPLGGSRNLNLSDVPSLKEGEIEPFQTRLATEADIPILMRLYRRQCAGKLVTTQIDETRWRYDLNGHSPGSFQEAHIYCLLNETDHVIGYFTTSAHLWWGRLVMWELAVAEGVSLRAVLPTVARTLKAQAEACQAKVEGEQKPLAGLSFHLGLEHLAYAAFEHKLGPFQRPYAWYVRVPDLPTFVRHIAPVLERRLSASVMSGFSGELRITFYRGGLRLVFEQGQLTEVTDWQAPDTDHHWDGAGFPPLVFLQLLFGYRSLPELRNAFPDCWADEEPTLLLNALFPKQTSWVVPLG
jgi:predicted N-acetyltransferase YhbS